MGPFVPSYAIMKFSLTLKNAISVCICVAVFSCFNTDQVDKGAQSSPVMSLVEVSNGFGRLLPYVIPVPDAQGNPSAQLIEIRNLEDLYNNPSTAANPILPPAAWPDTAINPSNAPGNHFVYATFSHDIFETSVLDPTAAGLANNGLTGAITVIAYDKATGESTPVPGRAFINGYTYYGVGPTRERWVRPNGQSGVNPITFDRDGVIVTPGLGFPGTDDPNTGVPNGAFPSAGKAINRDTFIFVVDSDDDLTTYETFPAGKSIRMVIKGTESGVVEGGVRSRQGYYLQEGGIASSSVAGDDGGSPLTLLDGNGGQIVTQPVDLSTDVSCDQEIRWAFDEACQPHSVGPLPGLTPPSLSNEFTVEFFPPVSPGSPQPGSTVELPYTVSPVSPFNFTEFIITPVVSFPGSDPFGAQAEVNITYFDKSAEDLFGNIDDASIESDTIVFTVGSDCPGLVNAPVMPGAIMIGSSEGLKVLDLDGFGQGTGDPTHDYNNTLYNATFDADGNPSTGDVSKFPFNPNLNVQGIFPPLTSDTTSLAGGSRGVFTLTQDSTLRTSLTSSNDIGTISDIVVGHPLDIAYNNFQCLSGGANACASSSFQTIPLSTSGGVGNNISNAPHPNPPRIQLSPSCYQPLIQTEEPTRADANLTNRLTYGDAFGSLNGFGPSGLLTQSTNYAGFWGPAPSAATCPTFTLRQQIGHILYVLDSTGSQVVAVNSNRMTVIDKIPVGSPRDLAISPDMNLLAVSNNSASTVTFIDTDPLSPSFHEVVKTVSLVDANNRRALGPTELVWQGDGEDILVICDRSDSLVLIAGNGLEVRKIISGITDPKLLAVTDRSSSSFNTGLYYAYIVSEGGDMQIFESGPDGLQGIGFDDIIGSPQFDDVQRTGFNNPSAICINPGSIQHGVYVGYSEDSKAIIDEIWLDSSPFGPVSLRIPPGPADPNRRDKEWRVIKQYKDVFSSSAILDIAVDDMNNIGATSTTYSSYAGGNIVAHSGKKLSRGQGTPVSYPTFLLAATSSGYIDVLDVTSGTEYISPIRVQGISVLAHYWRQ